MEEKFQAQKDEGKTKPTTFGMSMLFEYFYKMDYCHKYQE